MEIDDLSFEVLEEIQPALRFEREAFWIERLSMTEKMVNKRHPVTQKWEASTFGTGRMKGKKHSEASKQKIAKAIKGRKGRLLTPTQSAYMRSFRKCNQP